MPHHRSSRHSLSEYRRDALRTTLWVVPTIEIAVAVALFVVTYLLDWSVYHGHITLPAWVNNGNADAARQILTAIAAAVITVVGLVFSITIVALTLASTQFGPRMLRNFIRDRGTQVTLGTFVATFVYATLTLGAVAHGNPGFVPHLSITVAMVLVLADLAVLVYFIHHVATSIQLPNVIAGIARDLSRSIDTEMSYREAQAERLGDLSAELTAREALAANGAPVVATRSGYLQFVGYARLIDIARRGDAVIELLHRPGHFVVEGLPLAEVAPATAAPNIARALDDAHATGAYRTISQDLAFSIDQLVEIAIRALSPAVNDTFTALTCIDWLTDALCKISRRWEPRRAHIDDGGRVRVIDADLSYDRLLQRAFDKIRQAGRGMPAVLIRQLSVLARIVEQTTEAPQRQAVLAEAEMLLRASEESVPEPSDRADVRRRFDEVVTALAIADTVEAADARR